MDYPEILAPVGGQEQLTAAVRAGADAVYLGGKGFNARQSARNFDEEALAAAVRYCHARNVAVHATLNTLVRDEELGDVLHELEALCKAGVDAVIVQDLAVAKLVREHCPDLAMHASTQMTIHNAAGARALESLGFSRIVLARELTLAEIERIAAETRLETEVFVHGALCMCVSGGCYLSAMLGGRSGNRGRCAQPCRLDFKAPDGRGYALSLRDMSHIAHLGALARAGVRSFKIEGRMKRPEYVAAAVAACRGALRGEGYDEALLRDLFSRGGFTDGYLTGRRTAANMFGRRTKEDAALSAQAAGKTGALTRAERQSVPVDLCFTLRAGQPAALRASDGQNTAEAGGAVAEPARSRPVDAEFARRSLCKTGGTPFFVRSFEAALDPGLSLPVSALNELRRRALDSLLEQRSAPAPRLFADMPLCPPPPYEPPAAQQLRVRAERFGQLSRLPAEKIDRFILPLEEILAQPEAAAQLHGRLIAELPALCFPSEEPRLTGSLERLRGLGVRDLLCENLGALRLAAELGFSPHGGHGLNILNSEALCEYERLGLRDATVSFELDLKRIRALGGVAPRGILAYGYLPLMRFRTCPVQGKAGCGSCDGRRALTDRTGARFTVLCSGRRYQSLLNSVPLALRAGDCAGVDFCTLYFTVESPDRALAVTTAFLAGSPPPEPHTNGLYFREIE